MKTYLHEEFVDESLLTERERQDLEAIYQATVESVEKKYALMQQRFMDEEEALYEKLAREAGFSGYSTGEDSYSKYYQISLTNSKSLSQDIHDKLRDFTMRKIDSDEYLSLVNRSRQAVSEERDERVWAKQLHLNRVLALVRPRTVVKVDSDGNRIMGARTYNKLGAEMKESLRHPVSRQYKVKEGDEIHTIAVDAGISDNITRLWDWNIRTNACCSGMVADHPFHRYENDDKYGRYKRGDLVKAGPGVCSAYLSLPVQGNLPQLLEAAEAKAADWGWVTERRNIYGEKALVFYLPYTLDGASYETVITGMSELASYYRNSGEAANYDDAVHLALTKLQADHGGVIHRTDRMIQYDFKQLTDGLVDIRQRLREEERQHNIETGRAVDLYCYDSDIKLTVPQLKGVFERSGIELDESTVNRPLDRNCSFVVKDGMARLIPDGQPPYPWEKVGVNDRLSYLMASQVKSTIHGGETKDGHYYIKVMIHPDAMTLDQADKFTVTKPVDQFDYFKYMGSDNDMARFLSNQFRNELYHAAQDAYDHSYQKKMDELKPRMATNDIRIRKGMDGQMYISCKVYGEQQLSKRMKPEDITYYNMRMAASDKAYNGVAPELANKYFKDEIDLAHHLQQKEGQGMKR